MTNGDFKENSGKKEKPNNNDENNVERSSNTISSTSDNEMEHVNRTSEASEKLLRLVRRVLYDESKGYVNVTTDYRQAIQPFKDRDPISPGQFPHIDFNDELVLNEKNEKYFPSDNTDNEETFVYRVNPPARRMEIHSEYVDENFSSLGDDSSATSRSNASSFYELSTHTYNSKMTTDSEDEFDYYY
ncbi:Hypothetical protein SRAE_X000011200 [Strongyloides ratti]|uniref:Uncharacterized protein n=1 Tax=Strongyloides ratti TaxID=34506 RepID=A0A090LM35_STRRB|nr:Hypothetical protein SRAE_X000011200 [Strongyloides ratti]CEF70781.1 Hypothetical protein SRAE_X000011200 [Strongyloides ratti]